MFNDDRSACAVAPPAVSTASTTRLDAARVYTPGATTAPMTCTVISLAAVSNASGTTPGSASVAIGPSAMTDDATLLAPANGNDASRGGDGALNSHHAPMHTATTDPAVATARAGPYQSRAADTRARRR